MFRHLSLVYAVLFASACGPHIRTTRLVPGHPPRPQDAVLSVFSEKMPECRFEELSLVTAREDSFFFGQDLLGAIKSEARRMGGDALIGLRDLPRVRDDEGPGLSATVVRFVDPECRY